MLMALPYAVVHVPRPPRATTCHCSCVSHAVFSSPSLAPSRSPASAPFSLSRSRYGRKDTALRAHGSTYRRLASQLHCFTTHDSGLENRSQSTMACRQPPLSDSSGSAFQGSGCGRCCVHHASDEPGQESQPGLVAPLVGRWRKRPECGRNSSALCSFLPRFTPPEMLDETVPFRVRQIHGVLERVVLLAKQ